MKDILTSPRMEVIKRKRKAKRIRMTILLAILVITIVGALAYFSSNHRITINTITVRGTRIISASDVEQVVQDKLAGKYLHLFARSNSLMYPKESIYKSILTDFPRIDTLTIGRVGWNRLDIAITERAGAFLYCGATVPQVHADIGENCYFINNDGYIFDKAPYFSGNVYFKYYAPLPDTATPLGSQMLPPDQFHALARFIDGIEGLGFKPTYLVMNSDGNTLYLNHGPLDTAPVIEFTNDNNLDDIVDNLSLSMAKPEFANDIHSKYTSLLYIDLRFKNKVLYKFQ